MKLLRDFFAAIIDAVFVVFGTLLVFGIPFAYIVFILWVGSW